ncbi:hypothetical protein IDAT_06215 [Pseudidiomarina atlantica]|uniref:Beta-lactamase-related domain-containing protein n=1 Tax=Pseudidiomarina atlantica TaxID=1517416 RepID=A0A094IM78_9GAMM|nr:hypothetical protein [Pseudidiomarina atlantica]KFZ28795.1 hypothetical protein IDAT_06215 [Pseudidiomarina atlantica]
MKRTKLILALAAMVCGTSASAQVVPSFELAEDWRTAESYVSPAKARFDKYIEQEYGYEFSCGMIVLTPDETLRYRYDSGEVREVASFSSVLTVTDYTPIYDLAKHQARPAVLSHKYYIAEN